MHRMLNVALLLLFAQATPYANPDAKATPAPGEPFCYETLPDEPPPPDCGPPPPPPCTVNCTPPPPPCWRQQPWGPCEDEPVPPETP